MPWLVIAGLVITVIAMRDGKEAVDRQAGRLEARIEITDLSPNIDDLPAAMVDTFAEKPLQWRAIYFRSIDDLFRVNPRITIKNVGTEPIEAIRVQTKMVMGIIDAVGLPESKSTNTTPWILREKEVEEYSLSQRLAPGMSASIPIARGLLGQMAQAQDPVKPERKHYGRFLIECYGKSVGSPSFNGFESQKAFVMPYMWLPTGFPEAKCKQALDTIQPAVEFNPKLRDELRRP